MSGYFTVFPDVSCLSGEQNYRKALLNSGEFPTIGKESSQVCEMILWGPAPPFRKQKALCKFTCTGLFVFGTVEWVWIEVN